ncbi:hypothetical protein STEG23_024105, partial [Scotinomys teguina]
MKANEAYPYLSPSRNRCPVNLSIMQKTGTQFPAAILSGSQMPMTPALGDLMLSLLGFSGKAHSKRVVDIQEQKCRNSGLLFCKPMLSPLAACLNSQGSVLRADAYRRLFPESPVLLDVITPYEEDR